MDITYITFIGIVILIAAVSIFLWNKKGPIAKKVKFYLQHIDGIWSVPLAFFLFWICGVVLQSMFGYTVGTYDLSYIQPLFLAIAIGVGATNGTLFILRFNFKGIYDWFFGFKNKDGVYERPAVADWQNLTSWQKFKIFLFVSSFYVAVIIGVYKMLV